MRILSGIAALALLAGPALADSTTGTILAFDRVSLILVMEDMTVWQISADAKKPDDLVAGDTVKITYTSAGDNGVASVQSLERL